MVREKWIYNMWLLKLPNPDVNNKIEKTVGPVHWSNTKITETGEK